MTDDATARTDEWRCAHCPAMLGVFDYATDQVVIKIKRRVIRASYPVEQTCGSCGRSNRIDIAPSLDAVRHHRLSSSSC